MIGSKENERKYESEKKNAFGTDEDREGFVERSAPVVILGNMIW